MSKTTYSNSMAACRVESLICDACEIEWAPSQWGGMGARDVGGSVVLSCSCGRDLAVVTAPWLSGDDER